MRRRAATCISAAITLLWPCVRAADPADAEPAITQTQIEADWLLQDAVRHRSPSPTRQQDAAGACDGVKDGMYGFHTGRDAHPWWQVDLGESLPLSRIVIYNRGDGNVEDRAANLWVMLLGDDGRWRAAHRQNGVRFGGQRDGKPLAIAIDGQRARWVRIQLPGPGYLHLDEVEVYGAGGRGNLALGKPADQSSTSEWSNFTIAPAARLPDPELHIAEAVSRGSKLAAELRRRGVNVESRAAVLRGIATAQTETRPDAKRRLYLQARRVVREMALENPLLDFDDLLFVKRVPGSFTHMSDQYYGWFSRPGGGLYVLQGFKTDSPKLRCLTHPLPEGSVLRPDISYDGKRALFAHCKHYPGLSEEPNKLDKSNVPEDAFYHLYEINLDGSSLRRLTRGKYDDFDGRYLPDGRIVFLSTRRGQHVQCAPDTAKARGDGAGPDCYVRCGGGPERPVAVYTLHVMNADGGGLEQLSAFEMFEWTPSVDDQGRILYARWDYVDRYNMPYMSLWSTNPDGTNAQAVFGNFTVNPHCFFEARSIPASSKLIFTASAHHAFTGGCLVLLDPRRERDGQEPMTRLTPEVCFPESEGWPGTYFASPYPLSEEHYLAAWSGSPLPPGTPRPNWGMPGPPNDLGIYLFDTFGNLNLLYRDPAISSMDPIPIRPRPRPMVVASRAKPDGPDEAELLLMDVCRGLEAFPRGTIRRLRIVGVPPKTHPAMNQPVMGLTRDDPGKFVMGTVPVEADGSAYFRVPSGVTLFLQALDEDGMAAQTMRSAIYLQPGQQFACIGCHEQRITAPPNTASAAMFREPSKIEVGPQGSWPFDYQVLVQPVLDRQCVSCHQPGKEGAKWDLTPGKSHETLTSYGTPSLRDRVTQDYKEGRSVAGRCAARTSPLWPVIDANHYDVKIAGEDRQRLITWMDAYGQVRGSFDAQQEEGLRDLRRRMAPILAE